MLCMIVVIGLVVSFAGVSCVIHVGGIRDSGLGFARAGFIFFFVPRAVTHVSCHLPSPQKSCEEYLLRELETNKLPSYLGEGYAIGLFFSAVHD